MRFVHFSLPRWLIRLSIFLFVICLPQPGFETGYESFVSGFVLLLGWLNFASQPVTTIPWLANPFLLISWILFTSGTRASAFAFSGAAFVLASLFLVLQPMAASSFLGAYSAQAVTPGIGFWLWLASTFCSALACAIAAMPTEYLDMPEAHD